MIKEVISSKQGASIIALFVVGSTIVLGGNTDAMQDSWIAFIIAYLAVLPFIWVYSRLIKLYPGKDIFDITSELFGNILGKIIIVLFTWYALHLGGLVLRNFSEFIQLVAMPETPQFVIFVFMAMSCIYAVKSGIETFGKCALIFVPILIFAVIFTVVLGFKDFEFKNLLPVFGDYAWKIPSSAFSNFSFPLAETVLMTAIFSSLKPKDSPYKIYFWGLSIGALTVLIGILRNILLLGLPIYSNTLYSSYNAVKLVIMGQFFSRIEGIISTNFLLAGFVKVSVCIFAGSKGLAKLFNIDDYKRLVIPSVLIMITVGFIVYKGTIQMFEWINVYKYYALPFQVILPLIILITAEIKIRITQNKQTAE